MLRERVIDTHGLFESVSDDDSFRAMHVLAKLEGPSPLNPLQLWHLPVCSSLCGLVPSRQATLWLSIARVRVGLQPGLTTDEYGRLQALRPQLKVWCDELASFGIPETLTHEEVHDANVPVQGERYILADWSDSSVAHPFFSMVVTIRATAYRLKLDESGPEMQRLRDAYLEPFGRFAGRPQLLDAFLRAYRLGMLNRALSWNCGTGALPPRLKDQDADAVPEWLQDFLKGEVPFQVCVPAANAILPRGIRERLSAHDRMADV